MTSPVLWKDLITSTETSSGGPLRRVFETHSVPLPLIDNTIFASATPLATIDTNAKVTVLANVTSTNLTFTLGGHGSGEDALNRALGCMVIMSLPSEATTEALQSLRDIWEFHKPIEATPTARLVGNVVHGRVTAPAERQLPVFADDEE
jgi:hypothetical protein